MFEFQGFLEQATSENYLVNPQFSPCQVHNMVKNTQAILKFYRVSTCVKTKTHNHFMIWS